MSHTFTSDFRVEFEQERERFLRRRFLWYAGVIIVLNILGVLGAIAALLFMESAQVTGGWPNIALSIVLTGVYIGSWVYAFRHLISRERMLRLVFWLIVVNGAATIIATPFILTRDFNARAERIAAERAQGAAAAKAAADQPAVAASGVETRDTGATESTDANPAEAQSGGDRDIKVSTGRGVRIDVDDEALLDPERRAKTIARAVVVGNGLGSIFLTHFFACLFLPWTPRESIKPIIPLLIVNAIVTLYYIRLVPVGGSIAIALSPLVAAPGALICLWRQSRFKDKFTYRMLKGRYGEMRHELGYARKIHESMFPQSLRDGPVRFEYRYEPMRQIGGDYLFAKSSAIAGKGLPVLNLAIVDVTGHGIGAALTVNRLHGEFERQFGERPESAPGEVLRGLNQYLHHTLATHSVYATAVCVQIDPAAGVVRWASAGHPPGFLRTVDGRLERLNSTTFVLGACRGDDFDPCEEKMSFGPGDMLVLYTDGAIEARNNQGRMLRVEGMQRLVASVRPDENGGFASAILRAVDEFRFGAPEDDTLVVEVWRPV